MQLKVVSENLEPYKLKNLLSRGAQISTKSDYMVDQSASNCDHIGIPQLFTLRAAARVAYLDRYGQNEPSDSAMLSFNTDGTTLPNMIKNSPSKLVGSFWPCLLFDRESVRTDQMNGTEFSSFLSTLFKRSATRISIAYIAPKWFFNLFLTSTHIGFFYFRLIIFTDD